MQLGLRTPSLNNRFAAINSPSLWMRDNLGLKALRGRGGLAIRGRPPATIQPYDLRAEGLREATVHSRGGALMVSLERIVSKAQFLGPRLGRLTSSRKTRPRIM